MYVVVSITYLLSVYTDIPLDGWGRLWEQLNSVCVCVREREREGEGEGEKDLIIKALEQAKHAACGLNTSKQHYAAVSHNQWNFKHLLGTLLVGYAFS